MVTRRSWLGVRVRCVVQTGARGVKPSEHSQMIVEAQAYSKVMLDSLHSFLAKENRAVAHTVFF